MRNIFVPTNYGSLFFCTECIQKSQSVPLAFCYVPSYQQIHQYFGKTRTPNEKSVTVVTSPVDRKILFFGLDSKCRETCDTRGSSSPVQGLGEMSSVKLWSHLQQDRLWETVLEYYYSLCNVSYEKQYQAMNVYIRRRVKRTAEKKESRKILSYADIVHKLGICNAQAHLQISKQGSQNHEEPVTDDSDGSTSASTEVDSKSTNRSDSVLDISGSASSNEKVEVPARHVQLSNTSNNESCEMLASGSNKDNKPVKSVEDRTVKSCRSPGHNNVRHSRVLIEMEKEHMDKLSRLPSGRWSIIEDLVLVHFICDVNKKSKPGRCKVKSYAVIKK